MMTPRRRDLLLRVMDGRQNLAVVMFQWHTHFTRCDEILEWCIKNRLTGKALEKFCESKILDPTKRILAKIDRQRHLQPVIVGRDYVKAGHSF